MFIHHLKIALRNLRRYKSQTLIGVLGLTTACLVFAICFYAVFLILTINTEFPDHERMYQVKTHNYQSITGDVKQTLGELSGVEKYTVFQSPKQYYGHLLMEGNEPDRFIQFQLQEADANFWNFFSLQAIMGNPQAIMNQPNSVALFEKTAKKIGMTDALPGKVIVINDVAYTITGILKNPAVNSMFLQGDGLVFNQENGYYQQIRDKWNPWYVHVLVMLQKGMAQNTFQTTLDAFSFAVEGDQNSDNKVFVSSINEIEQEGLLLLVVLSVIGLLVLSVALFNIISFQTAQFYNRLSECAIRKVAGSGKGQLLLSFYMEIFIVFVLSFVVGILIVDWIAPVLRQTELAAMVSDDAVSGMKKQLLFSVFFGLVITFLFCLIPVQMISRQSVRVVFMGLSEKISKQRGRKIMLFAQMFVMLLFLSGTLILRLQVNKVKDNIWHTLSAEEKKNIFCFTYEDEATPGQFELILQQLKSSSDIEDVFFSTYPLYSYGSLFSTTIDQHENQSVREYKVSGNFSDFFHVKLIAGRLWSENDIHHAIVVDETLAALFPDHNPLGMNINGKVIIGVVENIQMVKENQEVTQIKRPVFYSRIDKSERWGELYVKAKTGKTENVQQHIKQIQNDLYPEFSKGYTDFQTSIRMGFYEYMISRFLGMIFVICLILCLLSIFSAITMNTEKRRKEVAIRKINGAEIKDIIMLFSKTYLLLWSGVCLLVFPVIYFAGNLWLETFNQRITLNAPFFAGIYFGILALMFLMIIFRIMEVARCNPAEVVKGE
jgi:ABC-type antimicrobial peptide transport system permease subunit